MARVLIVDDDEADRLIHQTILESRGHTAHFAADGAEALEIYVATAIDVVVTDLHMPTPDGLELIGALTEIDPDVAIVVVSGESPGALGLAKVSGARVSLPKPVDPQRLVDAVEAAALPT
jgi:CheY-like chemotaxis protein